MGLDEELESLKWKRKSAKGKFTRKVNLLKEGLDRDDPDAVLQANFNEVQETFKLLENTNEKIMDFVRDNNLEDELVEESEQYILDCERIKNEVHVRLNKQIREDTKAKNTMIKVKPFEPPKFNGNLRDYPSFKADFEKLVKNLYGPDPFALRMCLSGEALQIVKGSEYSYEEMVKRLDDRFGNPRKIVDVVIGDLKSLKKVGEDDSKGFIKMVNQLEQCWLDLKNVNLSAELNTANVVSRVEKILPSVQKREWVLLAESITDPSDLFPKLLEFLLREKRVLEYMNSNIRVSGNSDGKATVHSVSLHENGSASESELMCLIRKMQEDQSAKNKEFEKCIVDLTEMVNKVNLRNGSKFGSCWMHNTNNHDILECKMFKDLNNLEKVDVVRKNGICFKCLRGSHFSRNCRSNKTCDVKINNESLCGRHHHPLLHHAQVDGLLNNTVRGRAAKTLLNISTVYANGQPLTVLWDSGSDISLITHHMARKLGLKGKSINLSMIKIGNVTERYFSQEYCVPLQDKQNNIWNICVVGISEISAKVEKIDMSKVSGLFGESLSKDLIRPYGEIDMLIGTNYCELLPKVVQTNGGMQLLENQFGLSVRGRHNIGGPGNNSHHVIENT